MGPSSLLASPQKPGSVTIADGTELLSTTLLSCGPYAHTNYLSKIRPWAQTVANCYGGTKQWN